MLDLDGRQVQLQFWLCSADHGTHAIITFTTKVTTIQTRLKSTCCGRCPY